MRRRGWGIFVLILAAVSAVVLVREFRSLPVNRASGRYSIVAAWFAERVLGQQWQYNGHSWGHPIVYAFKTRDGLRMLTAGTNLSEAEDVAQQGRATVRWAWYLPESTLTGWWQPTKIRTTHAVRISPVVTVPSEPFPINEADIAAMRGAMVDYLGDPSLRAWFRWLRPVDPRLKEVDYVETEILWSGVARNVLAVLALAGLVYGMWLAPWALRDVRATHRRRRGGCGRCGYSRDGAVAAKCPECGEEWEEGTSKKPI